MIKQLSKSTATSKRGRRFYNLASKRRVWSLWVLILLGSALLRLAVPDWDAGISAHPDERFLLGVVQATPLWGDPCVAAPEFAYGHLPVYLARLQLLLAPRADPLYALRLFSGLLGVLCVAVAGALGRVLAGRRGALFAAVVLAGAPFCVQQGHFYTVDSLGMLFTSLTLLLAMRRRWRGAAALAGLAVACKASLVCVFVPLLWAQWAILEPRPRKFWRFLRALAGRVGAEIVLPGLLAFALVSPWALLRPFSAWRGPLIQAGMVSGRLDFPFTRQYAQTLPFVYPLSQMAFWGLGPLTIAGFWGLAAAAKSWRALSFSQRCAWVWTVTCFLALGGLYVKFPRYLLPLYPFLAGWAGWLLLRAGSADRRVPWARRFIALGLGGATLLLGVAQVGMYARPHPWIAASRWIYANLLPTETLAVEHWDHALPVPLPAEESAWYSSLSLPVFDADSPEKLAQLEAAAQEVDLIVLASRRGYGALARQPERYAATLAWYRRLFAEREVLVFSRCPGWGPLAVSDDVLADAGIVAELPLSARCAVPFVLRLPRLDESFRVYDSPVVILLLKK